MQDTALEQLGRWHATYHAWLMEAALPLWWENGADRKTGGFEELLDAEAKPLPQPRRARVQGRQSYVYAMGGHLGWSGPWQAGAVHGLDYLIRHYRRPDGLLATMVSPEGTIIDDSAMLYDQAFALLAAAWAHRLLPERTDLTAFARNLLDLIVAKRQHPAGGFREEGAEAFLSNPHMHLFEASLAWIEAGGDDAWHRLADEIAELCIGHFVDQDTQSLHEYFDARWVLLPGEKGRSIEPGHQFEWTWLMERWSRLRKRPEAHQLARRLFEAGTYGVDKKRNVAMDELGDDFTIRRNGARLWPQTERLKAALIMAEAADGAERAYYCAEAADAAAGLWRYLDIKPAGLWRDKMAANGDFVAEPSPASSFYHIICAIQCLGESCRVLK
jgi:mannose-1-phosphate guanylyltransferase / mannose-6-phosphate isomerase